MTISTSRVSRKPDTVLDPNFFLPPGVVDMRYRTDQDPTDDTDNPDMSESVIDIEFDDTDTSEGDVAGDEGNVIIAPPSSLVVLSQTVRHAPDGHSVVDVILSVEDGPDVANYEVQIQKI